MERCCYDCDYFYSSVELTGKEQCIDHVEGECRRQPPVVGDYFKGSGDEDTDEHGFGEFPKVLGADWCGEFVKREGSGGQ
ncbi:MAG: hypothetical protein E3J72_18740 [Planctomycetota bacterium]|nr:MAG: hypothetical protein E3J72_18740 [Planctomycetota bacterium]